MKVLQVIPTLSGLSGGPAQGIKYLCLGLKSRSVDVAILTADAPLKKQEYSFSGVRVYSFASCFRNFLPAKFSYSPGLSRWLKEHIKEFDLLHIHYLFTYPSTAAAYYARKYAIPYILRPAGMLGPACLKKSAIKKEIYMRLFENLNLKSAAAIHFTSEKERNEASCLRLNNRNILVPNCIDLRDFNGLPALKGEFRKRYPQIGQRKIILFLSRLDPIKGLNLLIPALGILKERHKDFYFVLAGAGEKDYQERLKIDLEAVGLTGSALLAGFLEGEAKYALLADSDIFVLPSYHENFGMAVIEAMVSGLPVAISDQVGIYKLVEEYQAGPTFGLNSHQIALSLEKLLVDKELCLKMGKNGRRLVEENFSSEKIARQMLEEYQNVRNSRNI